TAAPPGAAVADHRTVAGRHPGRALSHPVAATRRTGPGQRQGDHQRLARLAIAAAAYPEHTASDSDVPAQSYHSVTCPNPPGSHYPEPAVLSSRVSYPVPCLRYPTCLADSAGAAIGLDHGHEPVRPRRHAPEPVLHFRPAAGDGYRHRLCRLRLYTQPA